jgi:uncharacterized protein (DUF1778 family)
MPPRTGRPPTGNARNNVVPVRYNQTEHDQVKAAAEAAGVPVSEFIRDASLDAARTTSRPRRRSR